MHDARARAGVLEGLSESEARQRLAAAGPNRLPTVRPPAAWRRLVAQLVHFFAVMLWVASALAFVAGLPELGVAIALVVVINGCFAFAQETRAERAAARLNDLMPRRATVVRDGVPRDIPAQDLVVGDVVLLGAGDRVCADLSAAATAGLEVDTSTLTGESIPTVVEPGELLHAGTFVVEGEATTVVTATGADTRLAAIARLTTARARPRGPLAKELDHIVRLISLIALGIGASFFAVALLVGTPATDGFLFAIGVTVALVPEGLLPTVTLSLAIGAQRMAQRAALVRRLESVETLGSTTFICTDKTGTLTYNEMSVVEVWTPLGVLHVEGEGYEPTARIDGPEDVQAAARELAAVARVCSAGIAVERNGEWVAQGDPMEAALDTLGRRLEVAVVAPEGDQVRYPFDPRRRRMSVRVGTRLFLKGAPDAVLPRCDGAPEDSARVAEAMAGRGLRVLAVADRIVSRDAGFADADDVERDLTLLGFVGLEDPPRGHARDAVAACRRAGIRIAMLTGDHPATAMAIAHEVGLVRGKGRVVVGAELPDDEEVLGALLDHDGVVVARVDPEDKLRIASALQRRGHVVAMTGDGVNDGPALHAADIGVAMGRHGTDVAREAADLVLLDDDFATIVAAIEQGRATFTNIRRFLTYHLTDNVAELTPFVCWALSGGRIPLALTVLQVLFLDIGTDLLPALALGAEPPSKRAAEGPPPRRHLLDRAVLRRVFGVLGPVEALMAMTAFFTTYLVSGWRPGETFPAGPLEAASGAAFAAVVLGQAATAFACRSATRRPGQLGWGTNPLLLGAVAVELVALVAFLFVPPIADLLRHQPPTLAGLLVALATVPAVLTADAVDKAVKARRRRNGTFDPGAAAGPHRR
jgi:magnesium-transporting ATPase (P-type)